MSQENCSQQTEEAQDKDEIDLSSSEHAMDNWNGAVPIADLQLPGGNWPFNY